MYLLLWELAWLKTGKVAYLQLCRFWAKIFALGFGIGVVTGVVLSYEFGTNFNRFSYLAGNVLGPLMSYEVLTAFFLEAGFIGIMLFGWQKVSPRLHLFATLMVAIGAMFSAFWILSANSWMHTPSGYTIKNGVFYVASWWQVVFNPSFPYRLAHMLNAAFLTVSFLIAGVSAYYLLNKQYNDFAKKSFSSAMWFALIFAPSQFIIGDLHGLNTLKYQPYKISAIEGRWETESGAPLTLFALPNMQAETNFYPIDVPKLGSLILTHHWNGKILGLKNIPRADRPYVPMVFFSFRLMFGIGLIFIFTVLWSLYLRICDKLYNQKYFLRWCILISPLGFLAVITGWVTTETGRQPWVIYNLLRTRDAATLLPPSAVMTTLLLIASLYLIIFSAFIYYLLRTIRNGPHNIEISQINKITPWLEDK